MRKSALLQKMAHTVIDSEKSKQILGEIIRKEFDETENEERAFELVVLAWKYQVPQLDQMLDDYSVSDFKWF